MPLAAYNVIIVLLSASLAERFRKSRCLIAAGASALSLVGTILVRQLPSTNNAGRYIGLILCASCANVFPMMLSLISSNVAGFTKKSTVNAVFFLGYCAGNIAGPQFFIPTEAPKYEVGTYPHTLYSTSRLTYSVVGFYCLVCDLLYPHWSYSCFQAVSGLGELEARQGSGSAH